MGAFKIKGLKVGLWGLSRLQLQSGGSENYGPQSGGRQDYSSKVGTLKIMGFKVGASKWGHKKRCKSSAAAGDHVGRPDAACLFAFGAPIFSLVQVDRGS